MSPNTNNELNAQLPNRTVQSLNLRPSNVSNTSAGISVWRMPSILFALSLTCAINACQTICGRCNETSRLSYSYILELCCRCSDMKNMRFVIVSMTSASTVLWFLVASNPPQNFRQTKPGYSTYTQTNKNA